MGTDELDLQTMRSRIIFGLSVTRLCWIVNALITIAGLLQQHYAIAVVAGFSLVLSIVVSATLYKIQQALAVPKLHVEPYLEDRHSPM